VKNILYLSLNMSMYGYGYDDELYGTGYRYPRRKREVKTKFDDKGLEKYARASIYNIGAARVNLWIAHLRKEKVYDKIRQAIQDAKKTYVPKPKDPERAKKARERELEMLEEEYGALRRDLSGLAPTYTSKYGTALAFENARLAAEAKIRRRATKLMRQTGKVSNIIPPISKAEIEELCEKGILM
jgi:hypothetical protein